MPLYTYVCPECGYEEEDLVSFSERDSVKIPCPKDQAMLVRKFGELSHLRPNGSWKPAVKLTDGTVVKSPRRWV